MSGVGEIRKNLEKSLNLTPINVDDKLQSRKKISPAVLSEKPLGSNQINHQDILKGASLINKKELPKCNQIFKELNDTSELRKTSFRTPNTNAEKIAEKPLVTQNKPIVSRSSFSNEAVKKLPELDNVSNSNEVNTSKSLKNGPVKPVVANKPFVPLKPSSNLSSFASKSSISNDQKNSGEILYKKDLKATNSSNAVPKDEVRLCNNVNSRSINKVVPIENDCLENNDIYDDVNTATNKVEDTNNGCLENNDIYDDVNTATNKVEDTNNGCLENNDIYDDVNTATNKVEENNNGCHESYETYDDINSANNVADETKNSCQENNDIYDDVNAATNKVEETSNGCHENIETYDDVSSTSFKVEETNNGCPENEGTYDDINSANKVETTHNVHDASSGNKNVPQQPQLAPVKPPKSFSCVDPLLFSTPIGLEVWLKKLLDENGQQLNNLNVTEAQRFCLQTDLKPRQLDNKEDPHITPLSLGNNLTKSLFYITIVKQV